MPAAAAVPSATLRRGWSIRLQIVLVALIVLLPMLAGLGFLAYRVENLQVSANAVTQTYEAITAGHRLVKVFADMNNGVHGYALTGNEMFMDAYGRARVAMSMAELEAAESIRGDPHRQERLMEVFQQVDDFFTKWESRLYELKPGTDDATTKARILDDERTMDLISSDLRAFVAEEEAAIKSRLSEDAEARNFVYAGAVVMSATAAGLLLLFVTWLGRSIAGPIEQVAAAAEKLGGGRMDQRVEPQGGRENRALANAFNKMADALEEAELSLATRNHELEQSASRLAVANDDLVAKQRESDDFLYVLSHDLRAPLINIQGFGKRLQKAMTQLEEALAAGSEEAMAKQLKRHERVAEVHQSGRREDRFPDVPPARYCSLDDPPGKERLDRYEADDPRHHRCGWLPAAGKGYRGGRGRVTECVWRPRPDQSGRDEFDRQRHQVHGRSPDQGDPHRLRRAGRPFPVLGQGYGSWDHRGRPGEGLPTVLAACTDRDRW